MTPATSHSPENLRPRGNRKSITGCSGASVQKLMRIIDDLEALLDESHGLLGRRMLDEEQFFILVTQLRSALPPVVQEAVDTTRRVEEIVTRARHESQDIRAEAQKHAVALTNQSEADATLYLHQAQEQGERLLEAARREAERLVVTAQRQSEQLITVHPVLEQAQEFKAETLSATRREAQEFKSQVDEFASEAIARVENYVRKVEGQITQAKTLIGAAQGDSSFSQQP